MKGCEEGWYLDGAVFGAGQEEVASGVEGDGGDGGLVRGVVLDQRLGADVPHLRVKQSKEDKGVRAG